MRTITATTHNNMSMCSLQLWERAKLEPAVAPPCRLSWLTLAAWPAAAIVGLTAQCALTATGIYHEQSEYKLLERGRSGIFSVCKDILTSFDITLHCMLRAPLFAK